MEDTQPRQKRRESVKRNSQPATNRRRQMRFWDISKNQANSGRTKEGNTPSSTLPMHNHCMKATQPQQKEREPAKRNQQRTHPRGHQRIQIRDIPNSCVPHEGREDTTIQPPKAQQLHKRHTANTKECEQTKRKQNRTHSFTAEKKRICKNLWRRHRNTKNQPNHGARSTGGHCTHHPTIRSFSVTLKNHNRKNSRYIETREETLYAIQLTR